MSALVHVPLQGEPRVDSRLVAKWLDNKHKPLMNLIQKHLARFQKLGVMSFEKTKPGAKGGRPEHYVLLNENQSYLLLTMARNTDRAADLKLRLIQEFAAAREGLKRLTADFVHERDAFWAALEAYRSMAADAGRSLGACKRIKRSLNLQEARLDGRLQCELFAEEVAP